MRPFMRIGRYLNSADFLEHVLLVLLVALVLMLLLCVFMAASVALTPEPAQTATVDIVVSIQ